MPAVTPLVTLGACSGVFSDVIDVFSAAVDTFSDEIEASSAAVHTFSDEIYASSAAHIPEHCVPGRLRTTEDAGHRQLRPRDARAEEGVQEILRYENTRQTEGTL